MADVGCGIWLVIAAVGEGGEGGEGMVVQAAVGERRGKRGLGWWVEDQMLSVRDQDVYDSFLSAGGKLFIQ